MAGEQLKIALICQDAEALEPWMLRLAERICSASEFDLSGLIVRPGQAPLKPRGAFGPWWTLETKLAARAKPAAAPEFEAKRAQLPTFIVTDTEALRSMALDIVIDLTSEYGEGLDPELTRFGVWYLDFLRAHVGRDSIRAILSRERFMDINLCRQTANAEAPETVATATLNTKFIAAMNHLYLCEKSVTLVLRELKRAHLNKAVKALGSADTNTLKPLSPIASLRYGLHLVRDVIARIGHKIGAKLGIRPGMFYLQTVDGKLTEFDPAHMTPQPVEGNTYYADPFLWIEDGETYCFFEIYDYQTLHGHLGVGIIKNGVLSDVRSIIKNDYHMSYPFLFRHDGTLYMLPETCGAKRIELWKCVEFPHRWERDRIILDDVIAADSSIAEVDGAWWLFTNISTDPYGEMNSELHIFKIDGPDMTRLEPHPLNPVIFDARTARNGGRILSENGTLYRASQNNSHGLYGYGLNLMRIEQLSMTDYAETPAREITPDFRSGLIGCHHIDTRDGLIVIDVRKRLGGRPR